MADYDTSDITSLDTLDSEYGSTLVFDDPSENGPNLPLGIGSGLNYSGYSAMPGGDDPDWTELEWNGITYFTAGNMDKNSNVDSEFGTALGSWDYGSNYFTGYAVYGTKGSYVYQMRTEGGNLTDVLLQSRTLQPNIYTFNHQLTFTANESASNVSGTSGVYQLGNNFIVSFNYGGKRADFFLQVSALDSRTDLEQYSTVPTGITTANIGSMTGSIFDVVNEANSTGAADSSKNTLYLPFSNNYSNLHTVTININKALVELIRQIEIENPDATLDSALNNMSNWSLTTAYVGTESGDGNATADFNVQNLEVHYDTTKNYSTATDVANATGKVVDMVGVPYQVTLSSYTTASAADTALLMQPYYTYSSGLTATLSAQSITLNGYWDTVDVHGTITNATVNGGASFNGDDGTLTITGSGNYYAAGEYKSLTATVGNGSNINGLIDTSSNITNNGGVVALNGNTIMSSAPNLTYNGAGNLSLVGVFGASTVSGLTGGTSWVKFTGASTLENNGGAFHLTETSSLSVAANSGDTEVTGDNAGTLTLNSTSAGEMNIYGSWSGVNGSLDSNQMINLGVSSATVTDQGGTVNLTGNGSGALSFSGSGTANLVGDWSSAVVVLGNNQNFNSAVSGYLDVTINAGSSADVGAFNTSSAFIKQNGGSADVTFGAGYDSVSVDMNTSSQMTVHSFNNGHGILFLHDLQTADVSFSYQNGNTIITDGSLGGRVVLDGVSHASAVTSAGSTNFSDQTNGTLTVAILT